MSTLANSRQRGSDLRIRSEAKAVAADALLSAAAEHAALHDLVRDELASLSKWRLRRRRTLEARRVLCLDRYMKAIREAQALARKGRFVA